MDKEKKAIESAIKGIDQLLGLSNRDRKEAKTNIENNNNLKEIEILMRHDESVQKIIHSQLQIFKKIGITTTNYFDTLTQIPTNKLKKVISDDDMDIIGKFKLALIYFSQRESKTVEDRSFELYITEYRRITNT